MTNHVRMAIYSIKQGTYQELMERAREGMAPILRDSPGFVFYSTTDVGGGRFVSVSTWQSREQAEGVAQELTLRYQCNAAAFQCDITDDAAVAGVVDSVVKRFGGIDILINDAAYNHSVQFADLDGLTMELWDKIIAVNLTGPMRLTKAVAPVMKGQGRGRVINIASVAGSGRPARRSRMQCRKPGSSI